MATHFVLKAVAGGSFIFPVDATLIHRRTTSWKPVDERALGAIKAQPFGYLRAADGPQHSYPPSWRGGDETMLTEDMYCLGKVAGGRSLLVFCPLWRWTGIITASDSALFRNLKKAYSSTTQSIRLTTFDAADKQIAVVAWGREVAASPLPQQIDTRVTFSRPQAPLITPASKPAPLAQTSRTSKTTLAYGLDEHVVEDVMPTMFPKPPILARSSTVFQRIVAVGNTRASTSDAGNAAPPAALPSIEMSNENIRGGEANEGIQITEVDFNNRSNSATALEVASRVLQPSAGSNTTTTAVSTRGGEDTARAHIPDSGEEWGGSYDSYGGMEVDVGTYDDGFPAGQPGAAPARSTHSQAQQWQAATTMRTVPPAVRLPRVSTGANAGPPTIHSRNPPPQPSSSPFNTPPPTASASMRKLYASFVQQGIQKLLYSMVQKGNPAARQANSATEPVEAVPWRM